MRLSAEHRGAQRGCHRERDEQRCEHGENVGLSERREQASGDAGQRQERHEHEHDDEARVDDGTANFHRCFEDDVRGITGRRRALVLAQATIDVLRIDDRVVDDLAECDREPAEHHDVQIDATADQHEQRGEQRQRDRDG